ncbi:MAG: hypothetical protein V4850_16300 [Myxococcota bacterium]
MARRNSGAALADDSFMDAEGVEWTEVDEDEAAELEESGAEVLLIARATDVEDDEDE